MHRYITKRLLLIIPTLLGAAMIIFFMLRMIPGDVCEVRLAGTGLYVDEAEIQLCREKLGLTKPILVQFYTFVSGYVTWDLGESMWTGKPITHEIAIRFKLSIQVAIMATLVAVLIAIPLGIISAVKQDTWVDYVVRSFSIAGIAMPSFWLGILIILGLLIGSQKFFGTPWMPPIYYVSPFEDFWRNMSQLIWPAVATGYRYSAVVTRMTRSALLEVLREDYIRTARAKGMLEKVIINRHALKNSMLPVLTIVGIEFAFLIGGLVVTEQVFNLNGLGRLFVESVGAQDFNLTQQLVMLVVLVAVLTNFVVDLLYAWLDPRIRYG
jgi:peptide/nickel transport system permease protein